MKISEALKSFLVCFDQKSGWLGAIIFREPTLREAKEVLENYIARFELLRKIRTDPRHYFRQRHLKNFVASIEFSTLSAHSGINAEMARQGVAFAP